MTLFGELTGDEFLVLYRMMGDDPEWLRGLSNVDSEVKRRYWESGNFWRRIFRNRYGVYPNNNIGMTYREQFRIAYELDVPPDKGLYTRYLSLKKKVGILVRSGMTNLLGEYVRVRENHGLNLNDIKSYIYLYACKWKRFELMDLTEGEGGNFLLAVEKYIIYSDNLKYISKQLYEVDLAQNRLKGKMMLRYAVKKNLLTVVQFILSQFEMKAIEIDKRLYIYALLGGYQDILNYFDQFVSFYYDMVIVVKYAYEGNYHKVDSHLKTHLYDQEIIMFAIQAASKFGHSDIVTLLLYCNPEVVKVLTSIESNKDAFNLRKAFKISIKYNHLKIFKVLLKFIELIHMKKSYLVRVMKNLLKYPSFQIMDFVYKNYTPTIQPYPAQTKSCIYPFTNQYDYSMKPNIDIMLYLLNRFKNNSDILWKIEDEAIIFAIKKGYINLFYKIISTKEDEHNKYEHPGIMLFYNVIDFDHALETVVHSDNTTFLKLILDFIHENFVINYDEPIYFAKDNNLHSVVFFLNQFKLHHPISDDKDT